MTALAFALLTLSTQAQVPAPGAVEVSAMLERDTVTIGEPVALTVRLSRVPSGAVVRFPELPDSGQLIALGRPRIVGSEASVRSARYELVAWEVGELRVPGSGIRLTVDGTELTVPFPDIAVRVGSVLPGDADVETTAWKPPADVVGASWSLAEKIAATALLLALIVGTFLYLRRRGRTTPVPRPEAMAPRERALMGIDLLERHGLIEAGELKGFYSALSLILRRFLAETESQWGLDLTTRQLMSRVGEDGVAESDARTLEAVLSQADLVKFAGLRPGPQEAVSTLQLARGWLEEFERSESPPDLGLTADPGARDDGAEAVLAELGEVFVGEGEEPASLSDDEDVTA